jgi:hypothetical protein
MEHEAHTSLRGYTPLLPVKIDSARNYSHIKDSHLGLPDNGGLPEDQGGVRPTEESQPVWMWGQWRVIAMSSVCVWVLAARSPMIGAVRFLCCTTLFPS